jgi:hypothetical protein
MRLLHRPERSAGERITPLAPAFLEAAAVLCGLYSLGAVLYVVLHRIGYPFALEWMEGGSLVQVARIVSGQPLYAAPSLEFVPFIYPPLYYYVSALAASCFGITFLSLRLVSAGATLGCLALIYLFVRRHGGSVLGGVLGVSLFAATFPLGGAWFDIGRVDMLALFLLLSGCYLVYPDSIGSRIAGGLVLAGALFTKQTNALVIAFILLLLLLGRSRSALVACLTTVAASLIALGALTAIYGRWFLYYVYELPSRHDVAMRAAMPGDFARFLLREILLPLPVAALFAGALFLAGAPAIKASRSTAFLGTLAGAALVSSWFGWINPGGYRNALLAAHAAMAVVFGAGFEAVRSLRIGESPPGSTAFFRSMASLAVIAQFSLLLFPVAAQIPTARDLARNRELLALVRTLPGEVFMPFHNEFPMFCGKRGCANFTALQELFTGYGGARPLPEGPLLAAGLQRAFREKRFGAVILDTDWLLPEVENRYSTSRPVFDDDEGGWPVTGWRIRPQRLLLP